MKAKEDYKTRLEMAKMHDEFINQMHEAYDNEFYIETVWYCYAIFEQRISRLISKYIDFCNLKLDRDDDKSAAISTRVKCIRKMINAKSYGLEMFDLELFSKIENWCKKRNDLVHGLISLKLYKKYDEEFKCLADEGVPLVFELYEACTNYRNQWYKTDFSNIPFTVKNCKCGKQKCINPNKI